MRSSTTSTPETSLAARGRGGARTQPLEKIRAFLDTLSMTKKVEPGAFAEFERELHERLMESDSTKLGALVAAEDLERLEETLAIMRDAGTMRRLAESDAELARGEEVTAADLAETIRNRSAHE